MKSELIIFVVSFIMFVSVTTYVGLNPEPAKGKSECYPDDIIIPDVTDIRLLVVIVSSLTMVCSGILLFIDIKEVGKAKKP